VTSSTPRVTRRSSSTVKSCCATASIPVRARASSCGAEARTLPRMRLEDMILISVDDHIVEPPDVFEKHLPAKYRDIAPRIERKPDGTDKWHFLDFDIPNVGLNAVAGRPPEEYGMDPTSFEELRPGTYDVKQRVLDMSANGVLGSLNFPSLP